MSIRPVTFNDDGSIEVQHDEAQHGGTIPAAGITWTQNMDGTANHNFIVLNCPFESCGSSSTHPVGGGADAPNVQQMFVHKVSQEGCACGGVDVTATDTLCESHVRLQVSRMDGPERWQLG